MTSQQEQLRNAGSAALERDLAEKNRQLEIEAALEKVRSRSLAMHNSTELNEVVKVVFDQFNALEIGLYGEKTLSLITFNDSKKEITNYLTFPDETYPVSTFIPFYDHPIITDVWDAKNSGVDYFSKVYGSEEKDSYFIWAFEHTNNKNLTEENKKLIRESKVFATTIAFAKYSGIYITSVFGIVPPEKEREVLIRFAKVFDQSYTRFLDLQKAEAQEREAKIQLALERVRARTMAMQKSIELREVVGILYEQLQYLDFKYGACTITIMDAASGDMEWWMSGFGKQEYPQSYQVKYFDHPGYVAQLLPWKNGEKFSSIVIAGEAKQSYDQIIFNQTDFKQLPDEAIKTMSQLEAVTFSIAYMKYGALLWGPMALSEEYSNILQCFAKVFEQTYTRFLDLQRAEAQAREAIKTSSLDRVRGEIASMRNADDLHRITPLVWRELTTLGIPFFRCGVMIVNEQEEKVEFYLSTPGAKSLATLHLPFDSSDITRHPVINWRLQKVYTDHWDKEQFMANTKLLIEQGQIQTANTYQDGEEPPASITLQFVPFKQGMMYVGSVEPLTDVQIDLVQAVADAFSVAYARYEDFTKLEAAKKQVENTLTELQATQKQLIQSEKMASLGELTAGIAHEIQNPLNFVNNFSEVNSELIKELKTEVMNGNMEEVNAIVNDIETNSEKINHHGKRADAIVKGMLQHSRSSGATKEPTDINALADEFLRLSYHGLRAKDKSFNASLKTDFDTTLEKMEVIPQDIGRVLLNLLNNAFYTVNEKKRQVESNLTGFKNLLGLERYEPTVSVSTKKIGDKPDNYRVLISVKDNGNGIPQKVVNKIFQPFFTTKPTGHGTGLGLSLSYDIIKAHGGEITVETVEGKGTEFMIELSLT
ncbi:MAG: ATP-binding protein [Ferruginibacter sp.]